jgi:hypothetical protein
MTCPEQVSRPAGLFAQKDITNAVANVVISVAIDCIRFYGNVIRFYSPHDGDVLLAPAVIKMVF